LASELAHPYANYAKITPSNLDKNDVAMKQPCDVNQPIEILYKQIEDAIDFAAAGPTPYSTQQVLALHFNWCSAREYLRMTAKSGNGKLLRTKLGHNSNLTSR
jgi:hypothetical protein